METPENLRNIMVTYEKNIHSGAYGDTITKTTVTKMGFYDKLFGYISVPPAWKKFKGVLLPDGWGGDKLKIENVIKWKYCD